MLARTTGGGSDAARPITFSTPAGPAEQVPAVGPALVARLLEDVPFGVLLIDPLQRPVFANAAARAILEKGDGIGLVGSVLRENGGRSLEPRLQRILRGWCGAEDEQPVPFYVARPSGRRPYEVTVCLCGQPEALRHMQAAVRPGMTTAELDAVGAAFLALHGARSAPILAYNYPGHTCISLNDEAAHAIPGPRVIQPGDLINIDVSAELDGYWADTGASMPVPPVEPAKQRLCDYTLEALWAAIGAARGGQPMNAIGRAVEAVARRGGYQVIRELGGHGVGRGLHEYPRSIPHYFERRAARKLTPGMVITLEPFLTTGAIHVRTEPDGWTLRTTDGSLAAQFEHTVIITDDEPILVTAVD